MSPVRFRPLEAIFAVLLVAGGATVLAPLQDLTPSAAIQDCS